MQQNFYGHEQQKCEHSLNFGVHAAWRKARDRNVRRQVVSTATLHWGVCQ